MDIKVLQFKSWITNALEYFGIKHLTSIQEKALPYVLDNKSLMITSQTGTGKTFCFLLPILNKINFDKHDVQAIVILPTKELARQVFSNFQNFKSFNQRLKIALAIGNQDINLQINVIKFKNPQIIIGTAVRILELIKNHVINRDIEFLVFDETDMLIDLGFFREINQIFEFFNSTKLVKIACSATTHYSLAQQLKHYLGNTITVGTEQSIWTNKNIKHNLVYSNNNQNPFDTLCGLINNINPYFCIIFTNTKKNANELYDKLLNRNINIALLHKDLTTRQRKNIFRELNRGRYQYLVATDLASRGLDINGVDIVISYGLPDDDIWYMHRIGRTGRMNQSGTAYTIYDGSIDMKIIRLSRKQIVWHYLLLTKEGGLVEKPLHLKKRHRQLLDAKTNQKIKTIIGINSKKIKPGYKKKMRQQIHKIKQRKRHEFIEKKIKNQLLLKNIMDSKRLHQRRQKH